MDDPTLAAALCGAWRLLGWTIHYPADGRITQPFGAQPVGVLIYSPEGSMSAVMQRPDRVRLARERVAAVDDRDKARVFDEYLHYAGRWRVAEGHVLHEVGFAMNPNLLGTVQRRSIALAGERLTLGAIEALEEPGATREHRIEWARVTR